MFDQRSSGLSVSHGERRKGRRKGAGGVERKSVHVSAVPKSQDTVKNKFQPVDLGCVVRVDFSGHQDVFKKLVEKSKIEMRTPENQILYFLKTIGA
jgi:hypothetical protein